MAPKRKPTAIQLAGGDEPVVEAKPKKSRASGAKAEGGMARSKAKPALTEPATLDDGWTLHPPSLIYRAVPEAQGATKIAAFDLDGTLVHVKSKARFAMDADDWKWFNKHVPAKVREFYEDGYQVVIFSNQGGIKSALMGAAANKTRARADKIVAALKGKGEPIPVQVFLATQSDEFRKPEKGMWDFFVKNCNGNVKPDLGSSFYCGDMAGRLGDVQGSSQTTPSDTDKLFAASAGIGFKTPEDIFGEGEAKKEIMFEGSSGKNNNLADAFQTLTDHYRKLGDGFKANAFAKVQKILSGWPTPITSSKDLKGVAGVGKGSATKIDEFLETGKFAVLEEGQAGEGAAPQSKAVDEAAPFLTL